MKPLLFAAAVALAASTLPAPAAAAELELLQTIVSKGKAGPLDHVALDAKRERLFLANKVNNTLDILDIKTGKLVEQKQNQTNIQGVAYAPEVDCIFVGLGTNGLCNIFDGETYQILKTLNLKDDADNVRYNPKTGLVYVAHAENSIAVIDSKTFALKADIKLPAPAEGFQMETKRPLMYVVNPSPSQVVVVNIEKNEMLKTFPLKKATNGHPLALDEENHRVYIGCREKPLIIIVDTETGEEVGEAAIPEGIDDIHLDFKRKRLYASCGGGKEVGGFLMVFNMADKNKLDLVEKVPTASGAKTCLFVPETGKLYLAVPRQEGKEGPEVRVYQAKP